MGITIGTANFPTLTAQPFGYEETDTRAGLTARRWEIQGLLKPSEWLTLLNVYDTWRNTRILDEDTSVSGVVGTTVALSGKGAGNVTWTSVACWFTSAPQAVQSGSMLSVTAGLVDANQALAVLLRQKEKDSESEEGDIPNLGTVALGSAVITLKSPMDTRQDGPTAALTATGVSYVSGPFAAHKVRAIDGYISSGTYADVLAWYDSTIAGVPSATTWFPVSAPSATAEVIVSGGVKTTRFNVTITLLEII
jgi:hypothetical protein